MPYSQIPKLKRVAEKLLAEGQKETSFKELEVLLIAETGATRSETISRHCELYLSFGVMKEIRLGVFEVQPQKEWKKPFGELP